MLRSQTTPVVVDLWAPWCGPCKTLGPILEEVISATGGKVVLAKVNVDENPAIAGAFQVQSIPAVYAVSEAKVVDGFMGAVHESQVKQFVDRLVQAAGAAGATTPLGAHAEALYGRYCEAGNAGVDFSGIIKMIAAED